MHPPASDVKLIAHRWAMHAVQALAHRDAALLTRVFTEIPNLPSNAVDTHVKVFGRGAPLQFHDYGFYDRQGEGGTIMGGLLDDVRPGDTLLLIALRQHDPDSAAALIRCGASFNTTNDEGQQSLEVIFDAFACFQLLDRPAADATQSTPQKTPAGRPTAKLLSHKASYQALFKVIQAELAAYHDSIREGVLGELIDIYTASAPERLTKVDAQMEDFAYRELALLAGVRRKYGLID